ncbi:MAG: hypothetical protein MRJ92_10960 [Nitrospira sp.]|nr:hypothetical protein [Nitrospira sp.]
MALKQIVYVPIDGLLRNTVVDQIPWGKNSAHMATITRQIGLFRVAVHAENLAAGPAVAAERDDTMPFLQQETARSETALQALAAQQTTLTTQLTTQQQAVTAAQT